MQIKQKKSILLTQENAEWVQNQKYLKLGPLLNDLLKEHREKATQ